MGKFLLLLLMFCLSVKVSAQDYLFGKVVSEDGVELPGVTVINMHTDEKVNGNSSGGFMIRAAPGQEIRFTKPGFERVILKLSPADFEVNRTVSLKTAAVAIEEVEVKYRVTGNLAKDAKHFGDSRKNGELKSEVSGYIRQQSATEVLDAKPGEFVQPVGPGFSGAVQNKWDDIDLMIFFLAELGEEYFTGELHLHQVEIQPFILFVLRDFEKKDILKYAVVQHSDIARFIIVSSEKISMFKSMKPLPAKTKN